MTNFLQTPYVGGGNGTGGLPPDKPNNVQTPPSTTATKPLRRLDTEIAQVQNRQGQLENGVIFPPGSGRAFAVRNPELLENLERGDPIRMVIDPDGNPRVLIPGTNHMIPLSSMRDARQAWENHCENERNQALVHQPGHQNMQNQLWQQVQRNTTPPATLGTLVSDVVADIGELLEPTDLHNLSLTNRHLGRSLVGRRQALSNATLLARGEARFLRNGDIVRQNRAPIRPEHFFPTLQFINRLPSEHRSLPLPTLITTMAENPRSVFVALRNLKAQEEGVRQAAAKVLFQSLRLVRQQNLRFDRREIILGLSGLQAMHGSDDVIHGILAEFNSYIAEMPPHLTGFSEQEIVTALQALQNLDDCPQGRQLIALLLPHIAQHSISNPHAFTNNQVRQSALTALQNFHCPEADIARQEITRN